MIPIVSNDVRRILNTNFDEYTWAIITSGSAEITVGYNYPDASQNNVYTPRFTMGQVIYNENIPDDTYIQSYDPDTAKYTMSANATGSDNYLYPTLVIAQWPAVSKMIWYRIGKLTITSVSEQKYKSIRYGDVSKTFADSEINSKYDYPQTLINDLGTPYAKTG
jgi:hypothetical protein